MKKIFSLLIISVLFLLTLSPVLAETNSTGPLIPKTERMMKDGTKSAMLAEKTIENLKQRAEKEINRRIESLTKLITRINEFKKLSTTQKSALTSQVQTQIDALEALLVKIQADTDLETLKADVKSIVSSYRIYALFMPQIQIIGAAERMLNVADQMSSQAAKLETKINEAKTGGSDTSELDALLLDMKAKIAEAKTQAQNAIDTVMPLTPDGFPGNKTILQSARQMVVEALKDLNIARQDGRKIIVGLMKLNKSLSPTAVPTP